MDKRELTLGSLFDGSGGHEQIECFLFTLYSLFLLIYIF